MKKFINNSYSGPLIHEYNQALNESLRAVQTRNTDGIAILMNDMRVWLDSHPLGVTRNTFAQIHTALTETHALVHGRISHLLGHITSQHSYPMTDVHIQLCGDQSELAMEMIAYKDSDLTIDVPYISCGYRLMRAGEWQELIKDQVAPTSMGLWSEHGNVLNRLFKCNTLYRVGFSKPVLGIKGGYGFLYNLGNLVPHDDSCEYQILAWVATGPVER